MNLIELISYLVVFSSMDILFSWTDWEERDNLFKGALLSVSDSCSFKIIFDYIDFIALATSSSISKATFVLLNNFSYTGIML